MKHGFAPRRRWPQPEDAPRPAATAKGHFIATFDRYGLPKAILRDNESLWGNTAGQPWMPSGVGLVDLGIEVRHGRPYHLQTHGKQERFHRSLELELIGTRGAWDSLEVVDRTPPTEYPDGLEVGRVHGARIWFRGRTFRVPKAFADKPVGILPNTTDGVFDICHHHQRICAIELDRSDV